MNDPTSTADAVIMCTFFVCIAAVFIAMILKD